MGLTVAIMQPYFLPYIGYFQLMYAVDTFVVYDNIEYTKKGWINRNRLLKNGADELFTIPLKKDSDYLHIRERELAPDMRRDKILNKIHEAYRRAPFFRDVDPVVQSILGYEDTNLFAFIDNSIRKVCNYLGITTPILVSSRIDADHSLKSQDRVIAICKALHATHYINPIGGLSLYCRSEFAADGIELSFLKCNSREYPQFGAPFVPSLSILDVMMFNSRDVVRQMLGDYALIQEAIA
jgi:hypothetical protein